ncbi:hypothetical protein RRG08_011573 [Elysia crispata]|uniref:Uncharacterized protein n=1 Tax=Elysia crispata TaxID=231223 RepID=A0AAE1CJU5_9GAST|nr:hypothetical protein RRG08_011573 [Elysia crispata]
MKHLLKNSQANLTATSHSTPRHQLVQYEALDEEFSSHSHSNIPLYTKRSTGPQLMGSSSMHDRTLMVHDGCPEGRRFSSSSFRACATPAPSDVLALSARVDLFGETKIIIDSTRHWLSLTSPQSRYLRQAAFTQGSHRPASFIQKPKILKNPLNTLKTIHKARTQKHNLSMKPSVRERRRAEPGARLLERPLCQIPELHMDGPTRSFDALHCGSSDSIFSFLILQDVRVLHNPPRANCF